MLAVITYLVSRRHFAENQAAENSGSATPIPQLISRLRRLAKARSGDRPTVEAPRELDSIASPD